MNALFNAVADLNINGREFSGPPFSIEFEQTLENNKPASAIVRLYNPALDTIKAAEATKQGRSFVYPVMTIDAGYEENRGTCIVGEITDYKVKLSGADKILEMKVADKTTKWSNAIINKTWSNTTASTILRSMLSEVGINAGTIELGNDFIYKRLTVSYLKQGIKKVIRDTDSIYFFNNGVFTVEPSTPGQKKAVLLTYKTGLIEKPEKIQKGLKFKTLFMCQLVTGSVVHIQTEGIDKTFKIRKGKKKFSTFGNNECEFEGVEI